MILMTIIRMPVIRSSFIYACGGKRMAALEDTNLINMQSLGLAEYDRLSIKAASYAGKSRSCVPNLRYMDHWW